MVDDDSAYTTALEHVEALGGYTLEERLPSALRQVGLTPAFLDRKVSDLSGGQQTKLSLAAILVAQYDVFLLDEPTNNLDLAGIAILEKFIQDSKAGFLIISHDRRFLKDTMNKIVVLKDQAGGMEYFGGGWDGASRPSAIGWLNKKLSKNSSSSSKLSSRLAPLR